MTEPKTLDETTLALELSKRKAKRDADALEQRQQELVCLTVDELFKLPRTDYLVDQFLPEQSLAELVGDSESLKSFFAIHLGLSIACCTEEEFFDLKIVKHGPVIYIAAEGAGSFQYRLRAWATEHKVDLRNVPFHIVPVPVNLRDPVFQKKFAALLVEIKPVLIIVDTLHRCTPGADESGSRDMGEVVAFAQQVQYDHRAAVLFLHHPPKSDPTGRGRGSSAVYYAADTEISALVQADTDNADGTKLVKFLVKKQKDDVKVWFDLKNLIVPVCDERGEPMRYASGRPVSTCVLVPATGDEKAIVARKRENAILKFVAANPDASSRAVLTGVEGKDADVLADIDRLLKAGLLRNVPNPKAPKDTTRHLFVVEPGGEGELPF